MHSSEKQIMVVLEKFVELGYLKKNLSKWTGE